MKQPISLSPGEKFHLGDFDADDTGGLEKGERVQAELDGNVAALDELGYRLYAEGRRSLLLVLQGMDTSGKDGTIRHVMQGFNPQSCEVTSFKKPSLVEAAHDFLWRIHRAVPRKGSIGIFNRSHYEDVLIVRVHDLVPKKVWQGRYEQINRFERLLCDGGTTIVKIFLHISKDEQRRRLQARIDDAKKRWKFDLADIDERRFWSDYHGAYEAALTRCNTAQAPWYIVPANRKWYRNLLVSRILRKTLEEMAPQYPKAAKGLKGLVVR